MPDLLVLMVIAKTHLLKRDQAWADEWGLWSRRRLSRCLAWRGLTPTGTPSSLLVDGGLVVCSHHQHCLPSRLHAVEDRFVPTLSLSLALVIACFGSFRIADMTVRNQPVGEDDQMRQSAVQLADISKLVRDAKGKVFTDVPRLNMLLQEHDHAWPSAAGCQSA